MTDSKESRPANPPIPPAPRESADPSSTRETGEECAVHGPIREALALLPEGVFLMTAAYEDERTGLGVKGVMACADEPVLIAVATRKGHAIEPIIRDSRHFALCVVRPDDRLLRRKFPPGDEPRGGGDPFDVMPTEDLGSGSPVPTRCAGAFDCEVVRHFDLDADHEIYVGQVLAVKLFD